MSNQTEQSKAVIENDFSFHPATTDERKQDHELVRGILREAMHALDHLLPVGREKSTVKTKLEEAMFWANAAIARRPE